MAATRKKAGTPTAPTTGDQPDAIDTEITAAPDMDMVLDEQPVVRRLMVRRAYRGADIQEAVILPGPYYEDDPFLWGLAEQLVTGQYAGWL